MMLNIHDVHKKALTVESEKNDEIHHRNEIPSSDFHPLNFITLSLSPTSLTCKNLNTKKEKTLCR